MMRYDMISYHLLLCRTISFHIIFHTRYGTAACTYDVMWYETISLRWYIFVSYHILSHYLNRDIARAKKSDRAAWLEIGAQPFSPLKQWTHTSSKYFVDKNMGAVFKELTRLEQGKRGTTKNIPVWKLKRSEVTGGAWAAHKPQPLPKAAKPSIALLCVVCDRLEYSGSNRSFLFMLGVRSGDESLRKDSHRVGMKQIGGLLLWGNDYHDAKLFTRRADQASIQRPTGPSSYW